MHVSIISSDLIQAHVLSGVADRAEWSVSRASSLGEMESAHLNADAIIVDVECVDAAVRDDLRALAARVGRERVFLLTEELRGVLPTPEDLGVHLLAIKPVHPADFLRVVQASIPTVPTRISRPMLGTARVMA